MTVFRSSLIIIIVFLLISCNSKEPSPLKVMTYNIRVDIPNQGENSWENRKDLVVAVIKKADPDIIGVQEALKTQIEDITEYFENYSWIGVAREDGKEKGEYTAIIYKKNRFDILIDSTFWLSQTPTEPAIGWDAAYTRTVTYAKINDKFSSSNFYLYNTHFDHIGDTARFESAKLILNNISQTVQSDPTILIGDFNCSISSEPYKVFTLDEKMKLFNSENISEKKHEGSIGTFTGFDINAKPQEPIDFIFVSPNIIVKSHKSLDQTIDGKLPSDHYPVMTEIILN